MRKSILVCLIALHIPGLGWAQPFTLDWFKIAGGGGSSASGAYSVSGTIGQADAGVMAGGEFSMIGGFWSVFVVQTLSTPPLFITRVGDQAILYWSATAAGYGLEHNLVLAASNGWSAVLSAPFQQNGFYYVTNQFATGTHFYRLRHP